jgi:putative sporulation protein YtxC
VSNELQQLKNKEINFAINKINSDGSTSIVCSINDEKFQNEKSTRLYNALIFNVSNALADYIIKKYEEKLIGRIINSNYCYFNTVERKDILDTALKIIRNDEKNILNSLFQIRRRNIIVKKLMEYFEGSNSLILDGFVNFRLKDYMKDLEEIVDKAVDDFLMEREYKEFIRLLRYFVDIQEPKFNTIHVIVNYENRYTLLDDSKREITNECIQEFINEISEGEVNYDDLLVSSLITLAPKRIVIHSTGQFRNKELLETIKNVFIGKVFICSGCETCCINAVKD